MNSSADVDNKAGQLSTMGRLLDRLIGETRRFYLQLARGRRQVKVVRVADSTERMRSVFILGLQRSGTTPLRLALDVHPDLACPPESQILAPLLDVWNEPLVEEGMLGLGYDRSAGRQEMAATFTRLIEGYAQASKPGASFWVDKTPQYVPLATELPELFPEAHFIVITRHPVGQINSFTVGGKRRPLPLKDDPESILAAGSNFYVRGVEQLSKLCRQNPSRVTAVSYEELCLEPDRVLSEICVDLGIEDSPGMSRYGDVDHDAGVEGTKALRFDQIKELDRDLPSWFAEHTSEVESALRVAEAIGYDRADAGPPRDLRRKLRELDRVDSA